MSSRIGAAVLATLVAGGLAYGQPAPPPPPSPSPAPSESAALAPPAVPFVAIPPVEVAASCACGTGDCGGCFDSDPHVCGPSGRMWAEAEALLWWMKGDRLPPLVTTSPAGTSQAQAGIVGGNSSILFGDTRENQDVRFGGRLTFGTWLDCEQTLGIEASGLWIEDKSTSFNAASANGSRILARPFFNAATNNPTARLVSFPGVSTGSISIQSSTDGLIGAGVLARENLWCGSNYRIDVLGGYRYLRFADRLGISTNQTNLGLTNPAGIPVGAVVTTSDRFDAVNDFHGFDFGLDGEYRYGPWRLKWLTKLAVGENFEATNINGATTINPGVNGMTRFRGGLLATPTNIGVLGRDEGVVVPELGLQVGCQLTRHIRGWVGYNLLYMNDAMYAGKQIDTVVNQSFLAPNNPVVAGANNFRPVAVMSATSLWAQGIDLGLEIRY